MERLNIIKLNLLNSFETKTVTSQNYVFESKNVEFNNNKKIINQILTQNNRSRW